MAEVKKDIHVLKVLYKDHERRLTVLETA
jgi:hypothetical protein